MARNCKNRSISIDNERWLQLQALQNTLRFSPSFSGLICTGIDILVERFGNTKEFRRELHRLRNEQRGAVVQVKDKSGKVVALEYRK